MKNNNKFRLDVWGAITLVTIALYALFLLYPMAYLIRQSVMDPDTGGFTLAYFTKFFSKSYYFDTLINSFKVSITATVLSIAIGTPLAYLFTIFKIKGKGVLNILIVVASMSAPFIGAYSWILLLGRSGVITTFFKDLGIVVLRPARVFRKPEGPDLRSLQPGVRLRRHRAGHDAPAVPAGVPLRQGRAEEHRQLPHRGG